MSAISSPDPNTKSFYLRLKEALSTESGAIDLASIMVGIIVIGMIGGVVSATVFSVIPWTQDNAAKQQLTSIAAAESAYFGLSSDAQSSLPSGTKTNSFGNSAGLKAANLLGEGNTYCVFTPPDGKGYEAFSQSKTGNMWIATDKEPTPALYTGAIPPDCQFIVTPYVDPAAKTTTMTYKCDVTTTGSIPMYSNVTGTEKWDDGLTQTYTGNDFPASRNFTAGATYKMTFEGTYRAMNAALTPSAANLSGCLRSVDHWGMNTGITDASSAFANAKNLTSVPERIPPTIDLMGFMFNGATIINDPNISKWNVSNVKQMGVMFSDARAFNQPLNNWDVSKVTTTNHMFRWASSFNQPLNNWKTGNVTSMQGMFAAATNFNQPLNNWNTSKVTNMQDMFNSTAFNQDISAWNVSSVTTMRAMFASNKTYNQPLNTWNVANVTDLSLMFWGAKSFNQPLNTWNTVKVTDMTGTFSDTPVFSQNIKMWSLAGNPVSTNFRNGSALTAANSPFGI